jgi:hypothetical protein
MMRAPSPLWPRLQRTGCPADILRSRLAVHPGFRRAQTNPAPLLILLHQLVVLLRTDHARCRSLRDLQRAILQLKMGDL